MKKYDLLMNGTKILDVTDRQFFQLLDTFVEACFNFAVTYLNNHNSGLADFNNKYYSSEEERTQKQFKAVMQEIDDKELNEQLTRLSELIRTLREKDEQITAAYREAILQTRRSKKPIQNLEREVYRYLYDKHLPAPASVKQFAQETALIRPALDDIRLKLHAKIEELKQQI